MTEGQKSFWISIGAGAVLFVAAAPFAYTVWKNETSERALVKSDLAELNAKITKNNDALAQLQKTASVEGISKELELLNTKIKSANDALTGVQKASLDSLSGKLEQLNANVKNANDALAGLQKASALDGVIKALGQLDAKVKSANDAIKNTNDALADIKKTASLDGVTATLKQLDAKIKSGNDALAEIQKVSMSTGSTPPPKTAELESSIGDLKKQIADDRALRGKLSSDIATLQDALKTQSAPKPAPEPSPATPASPDRNDVVVFYVQTPDAMQKAQAAAPIPPLTVRFEKIGGLDDNGQADMIIQKLKAITKDRTDCAVTVAGYADTLGGDNVNLTISKKRAHAVAAKLQTAFAGGPVHITEAAWGERRLQDWTPNNVAREANRRVDVSVNCKPE
jgi:outer membrane protein OmpA-like peptidoglycan-associated protein